MAVPDAAHMRRAIELSRQAGIVDKTGKCFGAVVVDAGGNVIGEGYNQVFSQNDPTWHGEMHAIREAAKKLGSPSLAGCTIYSSTMPCPMCTGAIYWAKISACYYGAENEDVVECGAFETGDDYTQEVFFNREDRLEPPLRARLPFRPFMRQEAVAVLQEFARLPPEQRGVY